MDVRSVDTKLGIDLGTTSVKLSLINGTSREVLFAVARPTAARTVGVESPPLSDEQDVKKIFITIQACINDLAQFYSACDVTYKLKAVGVTGQMHGIVFWRSDLTIDDIVKEKDDGIESQEKYSNLFTWQDGRCTPEFLAELPSPDSHLRLATGHGCATAFWLQRNSSHFVQRFDRAGSIMDMFVTLICGIETPIMSTQNAASWGYFNCKTNTWNSQKLSRAGFPVHLLPEVRDPGSIAGQINRCSWCDGVLPEGVDVGVGMGDLPCNMLPVLQTPTHGVISISTSAQIVTTTSPGFTPTASDGSSPIEYFPYFDRKFLSVAASLTGGNVLAHLVTTLQEWLSALDLPQASDKDRLFSIMIDSGLKCKDTTLEVDPVLGGERHQPNRRGSVSNIGFENLSLGDIFRATCRGIANNLSRMCPAEEMVFKGVTQVVGCGSALLRNPVLKEEVEKVFQSLPFVYSDKGDASLGAALAMCTD
ncbi:sedoheptulokinase-like [Lytechinus variegatus]|uniref:sedoheptulokinase-like n=1 Tax=Lytechinus variegatus TaxID=7654 RepID=UPI001BB14214|nr:sedoheptulokinase-like [Lytechinus variegatus]